MILVENSLSVMGSLKGMLFVLHPLILCPRTKSGLHTQYQCIASVVHYVIYDLSIPIVFFFCPFDILQYKFLSYREVLHVLSESSELSQLSELIELPEVFSSMEKALPCQALRLGDLLLELRFVSRSSETSRSSGTSQSLLAHAQCFLM